MGFHGRARELGLLPDVKEDPQGLERYLEDLERVPGQVEERGLPLFESGATERAVARLQRLREEERRIDRELGDTKRRLARLQSLRSSVGSYEKSLSRQKGRFIGLGWFKEHISGKSLCPVCGSGSQSAVQELHKISGVAAQLMAQSRSVEGASQNLGREEVELLRLVKDLELKLRELRQERQALEAEHQNLPGGGQRLEEVYRFVGKLEQALENIRHVDEDSELAQQILDLDNELEKLRLELDDNGRKFRLDTALRSISERIGYYARVLQLERSEDVIDLRPDDLTLIFRNQDQSRMDYLWEIGSGANWMGYHIATLLALHEYFLLVMKSSPVPSFLIIDQPSQVYFPSEYVSRKEGSREVAMQKDDLIATRRIFACLAEGLKRMNSELQIIVTEHADQDAWGELELVHEVENWRGEGTDYLIPRSWQTI